MYVIILKQQENEQGVTYRFGPTEQQLGLLKLDKQSGEVEELEAVPGEDSKAYFTRAAVKVRQHWKQGLFPEKTCWAS